ncbi:DUF6624 domain-containing protein [Pedobacter frigidisoli]|uniref:DUF6624 domain-containing protein n=1 Tax=Pedobacter frigidisoli TaxID=2530455 RepID=UPI002930ED36|nr:DUF6624 domain-containing protein [Pedobacter frigidisoli]
MKKALIFTLLVLINLLNAHAQGISCQDTIAIREKLASIRISDQQIRSQLIKTMASKNPEEIKKIAIQMKASDRLNQDFISSILDRCGWPKALSAIENNTIFLVIDHADSAYMNKYFPLLKAQADLGIVAKSDLATLQDRMALRSGQKQTYGTQTFKIGDTVTIWPIADPNQLDLRRKSMGLIPMQEYISLLQRTYQAKINFDENMTVEEAKEKMQKKIKL